MRYWIAYNGYTHKMTGSVCNNIDSSFSNFQHDKYHNDIHYKCTRANPSADHQWANIYRECGDPVLINDPQHPPYAPLCEKYVGTMRTAQDTLCGLYTNILL